MKNLRRIFTVTRTNIVKVEFYFVASYVYILKGKKSCKFTLPDLPVSTYHATYCLTIHMFCIRIYRNMIIYILYQ